MISNRIALSWKIIINIFHRFSTQQERRVHFQDHLWWNVYETLWKLWLSEAPIDSKCNFNLDIIHFHISQRVNEGWKEHCNNAQSWNSNEHTTTTYSKLTYIRTSSILPLSQSLRLMISNSKLSKVMWSDRLSVHANVQLVKWEPESNIEIFNKTLSIAKWC